MQRLVGGINLFDRVWIAGVGAGTDQVVMKGVVDAEIAHLEPAEVLISGRRDFQHRRNALLPL